jgi:hypothetical protein
MPAPDYQVVDFPLDFCACLYDQVLRTIGRCVVAWNKQQLAALIRSELSTLQTGRRLNQVACQPRLSMPQHFHQPSDVSRVPSDRLFNANTSEQF